MLGAGLLMVGPVDRHNHDETTDTVHEILGDDGEWKWVLTQDGLAAYAAGSCPL